MQSPNEFTIENLKVVFNLGRSPALNGINLSFAKNSMNVLLGQNGSGKSTLLRCLAGIQPWTDGDILRNGISRKIDTESFNQGLMLISEDIALPWFTLKEIGEIYRDIWRTFKYDTFERMLAIGEIPPSKRISDLSRGQKILAQFALGLGTQCPTILVDEVTAVLDPFVRRRVIEELADYQRNLKGTVVIATNIATEINHLDANVTLLKNGAVFLNGHCSELTAKFQKIMMKELKYSGSVDGFAEVSRDNEGSVMIGKKGAEKNLKFEYVLLDRPVTIEEMFIYLSEQRK